MKERKEETMESKVIEQAMYSYFKLLGKTAIVTGAGNGIGRGIAKVLARSQCGGLRY